MWGERLFTPPIFKRYMTKKYEKRHKRGHLEFGMAQLSKLLHSRVSNCTSAKLFE